MPKALDSRPVGELGLNTLRSDIAGMFLTSTVLLTIALIARKAEWFLAVAILMLVIAFGRGGGIRAGWEPVGCDSDGFLPSRSSSPSC